MGRRRRRRRGPGSGRGASRHGIPRRRRVLISSVSPSGDINVSSPTIRAYVEDREGTPMSRHDIELYLDGQEKRFNYKRSGNLSCPTGRLSPGTHTVEIVAYVETEEDQYATGRKKWTFNIKK